MKKLILFIFLFVLLVPMVYAPPPVDIITAQFTVDGLIIQFPQFQYYKQNQDITFHFHVFNQSNGKFLTNTTVNCTFHLFNNSGGHMINNLLLPYDPIGDDWELTVSGTNFTRIGEYVFLVDCEDSQHGGADSHEFRITIDGEVDVKQDKTAGLAITIFLLLVNALLFALPFWIRIKRSKAADYMIKRILWMASLLLLWFNTTIFRTIAIDYKLGIDNFLLVYWWMFTLGTFMVVLLMCYFMVVGMLKLMKEAQMKKRMGGDDEGEAGKGF